jgi:DNA primase
MDGCGLREAALKLACAMPEPSALTTAPACPKQRVTKKMKSSSPLGFTLRGVDPAHPYLAVRGIETRTAVQFGVGFYPGSGIFAGRLVIPIHNERGELVAYCGRAVDGTQPRYRFPSGFTKSEFVFNLHRAAAIRQQTVVVVEGFFDCLKVHQSGVPVVALMGAALYEAQKSTLLRHFRSIILMLDGDAAGRRATADIAARLCAHCSVQVVHLPERMQPDQMSADQIRHALLSCRSTDVIGPVQ